MLKVTKAASEFLNEVLIRRQAPTDAAVRIVPKGDGGGLATTIDRERDDDEHFDCEGKTVLVLDALLADALSEQTLDLGDDGQRLVLA